MTLRWRVAAVVAVLALVGLVVAACSSSHSHPKNSPTTAPVKGGVLRIGVIRPASLDPALAATPDQQLIAQQLFETLTTNDPRTMEARPALAASWTATPDQKQFDFVLRSGAVFSSGRAVAAEDVKYSLERAQHGLSGAAGSPLLSMVSGVSVVAPGVVRITLSSPWSVLPSALASPALSIVPADLAGGSGFGDSPVGSGPFRLASRSADSLSLVRSANGGSPALLDSVEVHLYDTVSASYQAFVAGQLDWSRVPLEEVESAGRTYGRALFAPYLAELLYGFNLTSPKFADPRFREAVSRAIDRDAIVGGVYQGTALPSTSLIPGGVPGHAALGACGSPCRHDVAAARALVATVFPPGPDGSPTVPTVFVDVDDDPTQQKVAEAVRSGLADAGIPAVLRPHPVGSYADFIAGDDKELFRLGWVAPFVSPDPFVSPLFTTASSFNFTRFSSGVVDAALASARSAGDPEQRTSAYQAAERAVLSSSSVAVIPIAQFQTYSVKGAAVRGLVVTTAGTFDPSVVWLAPRGK